MYCSYVLSNKVLEYGENWKIYGVFFKSCCLTVFKSNCYILLYTIEWSYKSIHAMAKDIDLLAKCQNLQWAWFSSIQGYFVVVAFADKNTDFNLEPVFLYKNHIPYTLPKVYNLMTFSIFTELCSHHHNGLAVTLHFPPSLPNLGNCHQSTFISVNLPVFNISYKWTLQFIVLCDWLSLNIVFSRCSFYIMYFFVFPNSIELNLYIMF